MGHVKKDHKQELDEVENDIADEACRIVYEETKGLDNEDGGFNPGHLWKLKDKIIPKQCNVQTAMKDVNGKLVTNVEDIKKHTINHFKNVLRNRPIKEDLKEYQIEKEELCQSRLEQSKNNKTPDWTKKDLIKVLKDLKNKKSRDPNNLANEIFDPKVAGEDLVLTILALMNRIKTDQVYPQCLQLCNITSLYKQKGPRNGFGSYRGIFRVQALRNILEN